MSEQIQQIDTSKYTSEGKVNIDGNIWSVKLPGAATEMKFSKATRRQEFLAKQIESGKATREDIDKLDELDDYFYDFFQNLFQDGTKDNSAVKEWVDKTPMGIIIQAFNDIKDQAEKAE